MLIKKGNEKKKQKNHELDKSNTILKLNLYDKHQRVKFKDTYSNNKIRSQCRKVNKLLKLIKK